MLTIPQSVICDCLAVFRRALPKPFLARAATPIHVIGDRECIRLRLLQPDIAVEYFHPSPSRGQSLIIPISALVDCDHRGDGIVQLQLRDNCKVEVRWEQNGVPSQRVYDSCKSSEPPFPVWPTRDCANDPSLLEALDEAMRIPTGNSGRLSLTCIQLRGKQGDVVATDGRQLLIQGGYQFPWKDSLLVSRTPIFAARELARGEDVHVAQTKTNVCFRIGAWTISLPIESSTRFPNVDAVIPKADHAVTRGHVGDDEAPALVKMLDNLPAAKEDQAPVTLDLTRPIAIRARAEEEKRCTEVVLPRSRLEGKAVRVVADRRFLQRALELGFRTVLITATDKPIRCQEGKRLYVWVPLDPKSALTPQANAIRVAFPAMTEKSRRTMVTPEPDMPACASCGSNRRCFEESRSRFRWVLELRAKLVESSTQASPQGTREIGVGDVNSMERALRRLAPKALHFSRLEEQQMYNILGSIALAYLAGSGTVTNSSIVGRGLFRAIRHIVDGDYREAGVETLAAMTAPALMSYASTVSLVLDVVDGAYELADPALEEGEVRRFRGRDAA